MICPFPSCARLDSTETSCPSTELGWRLTSPIPPSFVLRPLPPHDLPRSSSRGAARRGVVAGCVPRPPRPAGFLCSPPDRVPLRCEGPPCHVREVRIASEDIVRFTIGSPRSGTGTARCTGPVRTALDLLYDITLADATVERLIKHLLVTAAARAQVTARVRSARRIPHQATALARVNRLQLGAEPVCWPLAS